MSEDCDQKIIDAAAVARVAIHVEQSYDIVDELASAPEHYMDALEKLTRLVVKVLNDIDDALKKAGEGKEKEAMGWAKAKMTQWNLYLKNMYDCLSKLKGRELAKYVKLFAAMALAPDNYTITIRDALWGRYER